MVKACCVLVTTVCYIRYVDLLCCCCQSLNFNRIMELGKHLGWTFRDHLVDHPTSLPPRHGQGRLPVDQVTQGPTEPDFEHWISPRLLWPFSLLRLTELTGWVAWSLCKTFFIPFYFASVVPNGCWRSWCIFACVLWGWISILCFAATAENIWVS